MKKKILRFLSYILVATLAAAAASGITWHMTYQEFSPQMTKLMQLEAMIQEKFIGQADATAMGDGAAAGMIAALGDRWSHYIPADQYAAYEEQMANAYVGIGITIQLAEDESGFLVLKVNEGGPAEEAGMLAGDLIVGVEGQNVVGWSTEEVRDLVRGEEGTFVRMTVLRDSREITMSVERRTVLTVVAEAKLLKGHVGYVKITNFDSRCAEETIAAIESMLDQGADALLFDVRYNPGGYANELVAVLDYLLPEGELFRTVNYAGEEAVDMSDAACLEIPMAVLVNGDSYSAAEFFAAALKEYGVAFIVGQPTVGKGYFQRTYELADGSAVGLSTGKYFTPNGVSLAEVGGIVPDITVDVTEEETFGIYAGTLDLMADPQVLAAIAELEK